MKKQGPLFTIKHFILLPFLFLSACFSQHNWAPVEEVNWQLEASYPSLHHVKEEETLYSIAFKYDQDYLYLAKINHLSPPYRLTVGQTIKLQVASKSNQPIDNVAQQEISNNITISRSVQQSLRHSSSRVPSSNATKRKVLDTPKSERSSSVQANKSGTQKWFWPLNGKILTTFSPQKGKKGIDIASIKGDKIYAASEGIVAYSGAGLSGYGNLIIIKHKNQFLTAYANNAKNLVSEGQRVQAGQAIAIIGMIDKQHYAVHFEIRQFGKPLNPLNYLNTSVKK